MTKCQHCDYEFSNVLRLKRRCPRCGADLKGHPASPPPAERKDDAGLDVAGFAIGYATGIPISPSHGVSGAALVGAALHSSGHTAHAATPEPSFSSCGGGFGGGGSSGSYDSGGSSSGDCGGGGSD